MTTTLWKELDDRLAEGTSGGAGWTGPYEGNDYWGDSNNNGTGLDEFFQNSYIAQNAINRDKVQKNPGAYLSVSNYTDPYGGYTYSIISFKYEEQRPRQGFVSSNFRFDPLYA